MQYALAMGIPIFEYDKHGGCGYITPENIDHELKSNFSGRGTGAKLTAAEIRDRIVEGYAEARQSAHTLRAEALQRFSISNLISRQLSLLPRRDTPLIMDRVDTWLFANAALVAMNQINALLGRISKLESMIAPDMPG